MKAKPRSAKADALDDDFFAGSTLDVARALVGCTLEYRRCAGLVTEVEAYTDDAASHFVMRPRAGRVMADTCGHIYIYRIYGMHLCLNFTTDRDGIGAVLLRALEPVAGLAAMRRRRGVERLEDLATGPGRLVQALGVTADLDGRRVTDVFTLRPPAGPVKLGASARIGITRATDLPWRFYLEGSRCVSRHPRPAVTRAGAGDRP